MSGWIEDYSKDCRPADSRLDPQHDDCSGCWCDCHHALTNHERFKIRRMLQEENVDEEV